MAKRGTCGHVNRHNCRIWADDQPNALQEWERDSPKVNEWMGITKSKVYGPYMFAKRTVTGKTNRKCIDEETAYILGGVYCHGNQVAVYAKHLDLASQRSVEFREIWSFEYSEDMIRDASFWNFSEFSERSSVFTSKNVSCLFPSARRLIKLSFQNWVNTKRDKRHQLKAASLKKASSLKEGNIQSKRVATTSLEKIQEWIQCSIRSTIDMIIQINRYKEKKRMDISLENSGACIPDGNLRQCLLLISDTVINIPSHVILWAFPPGAWLGKLFN
ncbi:hypothetical protein C0J52_25449 [Blattella germanica]|nr:hypothetical protein C0J52_25449 [Blattella germanica]